MNVSDLIIGDFYYMAESCGGYEAIYIGNFIDDKDQFSANEKVYLFAIPNHRDEIFELVESEVNNYVYEVDQDYAIETALKESGWSYRDDDI